MPASHVEFFQLHSEFPRLERLFSALNDEKKFFEDVILKNLLSLEKYENVSLMLIPPPTGHINLNSIPKETFQAVEKILERKSKENNDF
jgi:hypothetical protein